MIEVRVESLGGMHRLVQAGWPTHIVSLLGSNVAMEKRGPTHMIVRFDDVSDDDHPRAPKIEDIRSVLGFSSRLPAGSKVLVHCHAGQSRSTAMAVGILVQRGMSVDDAWNTVRNQRSFMLPNLLICRFLDDILDLHGELERRASHLLSNDSLDERRKQMLTGDMTSILTRLQNARNDDER